ncbi:hypothetical protein X943_003147 [Babesia divergens]|uniref:Uncharacterized protein n=1 Tax=Babesia divergens TaxID=32595 RepID=A0AAD9GJX4_BABDI|nr:hypothetical protein X943_003147 [Babesia divergens]
MSHPIAMEEILSAEYVKGNAFNTRIDTEVDAAVHAATPSKRENSTDTSRSDTPEYRGGYVKYGNPCPSPVEGGSHSDSHRNKDNNKNADMNLLVAAIVKYLDSEV